MSSTLGDKLWHLMGQARVNAQKIKENYDSVQSDQSDDESESYTMKELLSLHRRQLQLKMQIKLIQEEILLLQNPCLK